MILRINRPTKILSAYQNYKEWFKKKRTYCYLVNTKIRNILTFPFPCYTYQKDEWVMLGSPETMDALPPPPQWQ
jgi:hypothetical protein